MDIRKFLGGGTPKTIGAGPAFPSGSALSSIREKSAKCSSPSRNSAKKEVKKRPEKVSSKASIESILIEGDSEGESPLPSSMRKAVAKDKQPSKKRTRVCLSSDSDDSVPPPPTSAKKTSVVKKSRIASESDGSPSPVKITRKKTVRAETPEEENADSDVEMLSNTDSENEFAEKKQPKKKGEIPGQTKLKFDQAKKAPPAAPKPKQSSTLQSVSPADFFGSVSAPPAIKTASSKTKVSPEKKTKKTTVSPSQKENLNSKKTDTHTVRKEKSTTPKKATEPEKPKESPPKERKAAKVIEPSKSASDKKREAPVVKKTKSLDDEFVSSGSEDEPVAPPPKKRVESPKKKQKEPTVVESRSTTGTSSKPAVTPRPLSTASVTRPEPVRITSASSSTGSQETSQYVPWVDKYKPRTISQLVGQHGDKSPMNKLLGWLKDWAKYNLGEGAKVKRPKPAVWAQSQDGTPFKAVLLSGTPGVGKTTCAYLACESIGLKYVEMNASDVRNKKHLEAQVAQLTGSHQIEEYFGKSANKQHGDDVVQHVLIMDEVDGMSGNEDRAGVGELIQIIKDTKIPIICICNDRSHPKMRSLVNYCFDLRFPKPRVEQIRARMMSIVCQEKMKIKKEELDELIELSGHDVRQTIYNLQMRAALEGTNVQKKDSAINTFEAARRLLDTRSSLMEKQEMFFVDYGIMPLFVQENYPNMKNDKHKPADAIAGLRKAADLISLGDLADKCIRSTGAWKLLNEQCMFGCALPALAVDGHLRSMIQFPSWLGKNSSASKRQRLMRQLASHAHLKISADTQSLVTDYVPVLRDRLTRPLITSDKEGVSEVLATMTEYDLLKDDAEAIAELAVWPGKIDPASKIPATVKSALTRALNKEHRMLPYAIEDVSKGRRKAAAAPLEAALDEDGNLVERVAGGGGEDDAVNGDESDAEEEPKAKAVVRTGGAAAGRGRGGVRGGRGRGRGAKASS